MANRDFLRRVFRSLGIIFICSTIGMGLVGCGDTPSSQDSFDLPIEVPTPFRSQQIETVSPPALMGELEPWFDESNPKVSIVSPKPDEVIKATTLPVKIRVTGLSIYKDDQLELGPHLHLILDNQPYHPVYSIDEPFILEDLNPGTHTLRVFAAKPWHESFKNDDAYAELTFHVFTKTNENVIDGQQPLLTYSRPNGRYGAEPIMVDYYLTHAPLHMIAQESELDDISDWQIRLTVNGEVQILDTWQPIYIEGLQPGDNWVQLELIDENNQPIPNQFNNTARLVTYEPGGQDTLSKIIRGDLTLAEVGSIVDPSYSPPAPPKPIEPEPVNPDLLELESSWPKILDEQSLETETRQTEAATKIKSESVKSSPSTQASPNQSEALETDSQSDQKAKTKIVTSASGSDETDRAEVQSTVERTKPTSENQVDASSIDSTDPTSVAPSVGSNRSGDQDNALSPEQSAADTQPTEPTEEDSPEEVQAFSAVEDQLTDLQATLKKQGQDLLKRFQWNRPPSSNVPENMTENQAADLTSSDQSPDQLDQLDQPSLDTQPASKPDDKTPNDETPNDKTPNDETPNNEPDKVSKASTDVSNRSSSAKKDIPAPSAESDQKAAIEPSLSAQDRGNPDATPEEVSDKSPSPETALDKQQLSDQSEEPDQPEETDHHTDPNQPQAKTQRTGKDMLNRFDWYRRSSSNSRAVSQPKAMNPTETSEPSRPLRPNQSEPKAEATPESDLDSISSTVKPIP